MKLNVLSLFDGMGCTYLALEKLGVEVNYFASEIDKHAVKVTSAKVPNITHLGDVTKWREWDLPKIDLLVGGSPCQGFSFAGKGLNFEDERSKLFFVFAEIKDELLKRNPEMKFLLENVRMKAEHEHVITSFMHVHPITINSALVSAQNRVRLYWTNIKAEPFNLFGEMRSTIPQPEDKGILLKDILETEVDKKYYLSANQLQKLIGGEKILSGENVRSQFTRTVKQINTSTESGGKQPYQQNRIYDVEGIAPALCAEISSGTHAIAEPFIRSCKGLANEKGNHSEKSPTVTASRWEKNNHLIEPINLYANKYSVTDKAMCLRAEHDGSITENNGKTMVSKFGNIRRLTPVECARLQTVKDDWFHFDGVQIVSDSQVYKMLGNGFTVDVIAHILSYMH